MLGMFLTDPESQFLNFLRSHGMKSHCLLGMTESESQFEKFVFA